MEFRDERQILDGLAHSPTTIIKIWADAIDFMNKKYHRDAVTTSWYRTDQEQHELCTKMGIEYYASPHTDYRAVDLIFKDAQVKEYLDCEVYVNEMYPYGKANYKTALYHKGTSFHLHLQCKPGSL